MPIKLQSPRCTKSTMQKTHKPVCAKNAHTASALESDLLMRIKLSGLPIPDSEHKFHPTRRWRFDFAYVDRMIAIEAEGGTYSNGRHTRGAGYEKDVEKYNEAAALGWKVLRFTGNQIKSGYATAMIKKVLLGE